MAQNEQLVVVLDFGAQYGQLIARGLRQSVHLRLLFFEHC